MARKNQDIESKYDYIACNCGRHFGVGLWDAHTRAEAYARMRDGTLPWGTTHYDTAARHWLADYEKEHGKITWSTFHESLPEAQKRKLKGE